MFSSQFNIYTPQPQSYTSNLDVQQYPVKAKIINHLLAHGLHNGDVVTLRRPFGLFHFEVECNGVVSKVNVLAVEIEGK